MLGLTLLAASIGLSLIGTSGTAQAASTSMCSSSAVPAGYVVTSAYRGDPSCGSFFRYYITNDLTNGMGICSATAVPAGRVVTSAYSGDPNCSNFLRYYITGNLYNGMGICSATAVPAGWVATSAYSGDPNCAYQFLRYYITRIA